MGQKTHPIGFRLGIIRTWDSKWFAAKNYALFLHEDIAMKKFLKERLYQAGISKMEIERAANKDKRAKMNIWTSRPGIVIGRKGVEVENLKRELQKLTDKEIILNITEVKRPEVDAQLVSENVALATGTEGFLQTGHEEERLPGHEVRGQRASRSCAPAGWRGPRWRGPNGTARVGCPFKR